MTTMHSEPAPEIWTPDLGGERMVEGIHYGWLMRDHIARYEWVSAFCGGKRVLDVATGSGYGAAIMRRNGAAEVVAVDREQGALNYAAGRYGTDGLRWVHGDAYDLGFNAEFDVVVSFETIEHLKEPERFVVECRRALKPGGSYIVSTPEYVGGPFVSEYHELEFTRREFRDLLERYFEPVELFGQRRELQLPVRVFGDLPMRYWQWMHQRRDEGNHRFFTFSTSSHLLYTLMDRINKAPNLALARAWGVGDAWRRRILPIDDPIRHSRLLKDHYSAMVAICRLG